MVFIFLAYFTLYNGHAAIKKNSFESIPICILICFLHQVDPNIFYTTRISGPRRATLLVL